MVDIVFAIAMISAIVLVAIDMEMANQAAAQQWAEYIAWLNEPETGKHFRS